MTVTERRVVIQDWYETDYSKTGWESQGGWRFLDDVGSGVEDYAWTVVEHLELDKFGNPILGVAEKQTEIE
jgi:hypothetical protein